MQRKSIQHFFVRVSRHRTAYAGKRRRAAFFFAKYTEKTQKTFLLELDKYGKAYHNYNSNAEPFKRGGVL